MKRVLITGANSYVGTNVEHWLNREPEKYQVDTLLDMLDGSWKNDLTHNNHCILVLVNT